MNDWWKMALAGTAGAGLLALTGGAAAPGLAGLLGAGEGAAAGAGTAAAAAGATEAAAAGTAAAAGSGATAGGMLAGEVGTGAIGTGAGTTFGGMNAANALGATLTPEGGMLAAPAGTGMFVTPPVVGAAAPLDGALAGTSFGYGSPSALAEAGAMNTAPNPGLLAQAQEYAGKAGKAASTYSSVNKAMASGQPAQQPPPAHPIFQGAAPQIAPQAPPVENAMPQGMLAQSGGTSGGMLRAIAQQRLRGRA